MKPREDKPAGFFVEALNGEGHIVTSVPPDFCKDLEGALVWFEDEIEGAKTAPPEWAAASIKEVRLTWTKETS